MTTDLPNEPIIHVDRAIRELRAALPVLVQDASAGYFLLHAAESAENRQMLETPAHLRAACLIIAPERATTLGLSTHPHVIGTDAPISAWIDPLVPPPASLEEAAPFEESWAAPALQLMKAAELLPAFWYQPVTEKEANTWLHSQRYLCVSTEEITTYHTELLSSVYPVSEAIIPLHDIGRARVVTFRPKHGGLEHLAIIIGEPNDQEAPVPVRLHSSCLTGDILGSMRCDCGEQLKKALLNSAEAGSGIVLYLNQEGRGIGIANKLKAYQLQDSGKDTVDANELLGYAADERQFDIAAHMLKSLGISRICLMTNNPYKIAQMKTHGIDVASRMAHIIDPNGVNDFYLETKAKRAGHMMHKDS